MEAMSARKISILDIIPILRNSAFVKNVFIVMSGTAVAQIIGFALTPIISRLYSPTDFGVFGSFNAVLAVFAAGVALDYPQALMLPKENKDAINLFFVSCLSTVLIASGVLIFAFITPNIFQVIIPSSNGWILGLLVLAIIILGFNQATHAWCVRAKKFKQTAASHLIRSLSTNGMQVALGWLRGGPIVLIFSAILGNFLASLNLGRVVISDFKSHWREVNWTRMKQLVNEYRDFPMYSASMYVLNTLSTGLPVLLMAHYYGTAIAGFYAFGERVLHAPMSLITGSLRQVLFQRASEINNSGGRLLPLYIKTTLGLFALSIVPSAIVIGFAPRIFSWVFGAQWQTSGEFSQSLILWFAFSFCNLPSVLFAKIIRYQRYIFFWNLALFISRAVILSLGGIYLTATQTILIFSLLGAFMNFILIIIIGIAVMKRDCKRLNGS